MRLSTVGPCCAYNMQGVQYTLRQWERLRLYLAGTDRSARAEELEGRR
jgi:hypothetical protein